MTDLQIGFYFIAGMLTVIFCGLFKKGKLVRMVQNLIIVLSALAILYTILSLVYFVFMKQIGPTLAGVFMLSLHKIVIFYIDGIIITYFLTRSIFLKNSPNLLLSERKLLYSFFRYFMAAYFICSGLSKVVGFSGILVFFQLSGYSIPFLDFIIAFEIISGIALLFKRTATIAALLLLVEMGGVTFTHYHNYFKYQIPEPFSNSLDSIKMLPFLLVIVATYITPKLTNRFRQFVSISKRSRT